MLQEVLIGLVLLRPHLGQKLEEVVVRTAGKGAAPTDPAPSKCPSNLALCTCPIPPALQPVSLTWRNAASTAKPPGSRSASVMLLKQEL